MKNSALSSLIFISVCSQVFTQAAKSKVDNFDGTCVPFIETKYENGRSYNVQENCKFSKEIIDSCKSISPESIYYQCNIFDLKINSLQERYDDKGNSYTTVLFKYSESNSCLDGSNDMVFLSKCDTFASYLQFMRNNDTDQCHAFASSALLGVQPIAQSYRNSPGRYIRNVKIPGNASPVIFLPSEGSSFLDDPNSRFIKTKNSNKSYTRPGDAVSALTVLKLVQPQTMTTKANLKSNPAKIRLTRGIQGGLDYLDFSLGRKEEIALNKVLSSCK